MDQRIGRTVAPRFTVIGGEKTHLVHTRIASKLRPFHVVRRMRAERTGHVETTKRRWKVGSGLVARGPSRFDDLDSILRQGSGLRSVRLLRRARLRGP